MNGQKRLAYTLKWAPDWPWIRMAALPLAKSFQSWIQLLQNKQVGLQFFPVLSTASASGPNLCKNNLNLGFGGASGYNLVWLWVDIPGVLQGRDFSDELQGERGDKKVNLCGKSRKLQNKIIWKRHAGGLTQASHNKVTDGNHCVWDETARGSEDTDLMFTNQILSPFLSCLLQSRAQRAFAEWVWQILGWYQPYFQLQLCYTWKCPETAAVVMSQYGSAINSGQQIQHVPMTPSTLTLKAKKEFNPYLTLS